MEFRADHHTLRVLQPVPSTLGHETRALYEQGRSETAYLTTQLVTLLGYSFLYSFEYVEQAVEITRK